MTAINILRTGKAVHLITDTKLSQLGEGNHGNVSKVFPIPHLSAAIATRGRWTALDTVVRLTVPKAKCFADLKRIIKDDLPARCLASARLGQGLVDDTDIFVIGWDNGPQAFGIFNHDKHGFPAWEIIDIPFFLVTPQVSGDLLPDEGEDPFEALSAICGAQVMGGEAGGYFTCTTVRERGIVQEMFGIAAGDAGRADE